MTTALRIDLDSKAPNGTISFTISNHSGYDIEIFYENLYFPGVIYVSLGDGTVGKFMDNRYLNVLRTSVVEAKLVKISRNSGFTESCNIKDLALIDSHKSEVQGTDLVWIEVNNLPAVTVARPNIKALHSVASNKLSAESELGKVLQEKLKDRR